MGLVLKEIPPFVSPSGKEYGPFKPGDVIKLPRDVLSVLVKRGLVKKLGIID